MKRIKQMLAVLICAGIIITCAACGGRNAAENMVDENTFVVAMINRCDAEIYGIHLEYGIDGEIVGDGGIVNADGSPIAAEDLIARDFTATDFPESADLSRFTMKVYVILADEEEVLIEEPIAIAAAYDSIYYFELTGDEASGFKLHPVDGV